MIFFVQNFKFMYFFLKWYDKYEFGKFREFFFSGSFIFAVFSQCWISWEDIYHKYRPFSCIQLNPITKQLRKCLESQKKVFGVIFLDFFLQILGSMNSSKKNKFFLRIFWNITWYFIRFLWLEREKQRHPVPHENQLVWVLVQKHPGSGAEPPCIGEGSLKTGGLGGWSPPNTKT